MSNAKSRNAREASAIVEMFQKNESRLKRFLRRFTRNRDDIEDICQETIVRAIEAEKCREIREPEAYLFGVAKNIVRKHLDEESRKLADFIEDFTPEEYISSETLVEEVIDERQKMLWFSEAVATLPRQCQRVFLMKKVYGYSHKDIAGELGISISTVEKHVAAGLKRCSEYLQKKSEPMRSDQSSVGKSRGT